MSDPRREPSGLPADEDTVQRYEAGELTLEELRAKLGLPEDFLIGRILPDGTREIIARSDRPWRRR